MGKTSLTVIIYTQNEEKNIKAVIKSARFLTSNIIVIDSKSTDKTIEIAKKEKIPVFSFPNYHYVEPARQFGVEKADSDWVFILDADERIPQDSVQEIKKVICSKKYTHYQIPRKNIFGKIKWLKHGGWWPDYQIRLINKKYFVSWPKTIHSTPKIKGETGTLRNPLLHYFHGDLEKMVEKTLIFEDIESDLLYQAGKKADVFIFFRKFLAELWRRMLKNFGFLDGTIGIIESIYQAFSKTITYLFLYEKKLKSK